MIENPDKFKRFKDLAAAKVEGIDYKITIVNRSSSIAIVAPHGGSIEPTTSEIASAIAGDRFSLYLFEGLKWADGHRELHISSELFDEPRGCQLMESADTIVAVHGRKDGDDGAAVWVGGLDVQRRDRTAAELMKSGFLSEIRIPGQPLAGIAKSNVCNRGRSKAGVQLEISRAMRNQLRKDAKSRLLFAEAVCRALMSPEKL